MYLAGKLSDDQVGTYCVLFYFMYSGKLPAMTPEARPAHHSKDANISIIIIAVVGIITATYGWGSEAQGSISSSGHRLPPPWRCQDAQECALSFPSPWPPLQFCQGLAQGLSSLPSMVTLLARCSC